MPDLYIVSGGLTEGDKILLEGVQKVKEDDKIVFDFKDPREAISDLQYKAE
jgi:membrane fusion protein (multidrug efflux system)